MLAAVLGCKSSEFLPATVTRPDFVGCFSCLWLPRVVTISHPSSARSRRISRGPSRSTRVCGPDEPVERVSNVREGIREEVAVGVERDVDRRMPELRLEELRMSAGGDHQRCIRVSEVVEAQWRQRGATDGGPKDARHEVVLTPDASVWSGEDEPELARRAGEKLLAEDADGLARETNLASAGGRLGLNKLPFARACLDDNRSAPEVDRSVAHGQQLALPEPGKAGEADEVSVRLDSLGGEALDLAPVEEAHLGALPPWCAYAEHTLVDRLASLLGVAQDHLERVEHQLRRARRLLPNGEDMVFDVGGADRFQQPPVEDSEPPQGVAAAREGRGSHALRVTLEPALDKLGKCLRLRRIERAERDSAVDLVAHDLGVALPRPDRLPAIPPVWKRLLHRPAVAASDDARFPPHRSTSQFSCRTAAVAVHRRQPSSGRSADLRASTARARTDAPHVEHCAVSSSLEMSCALSGPEAAGRSRAPGVRQSSRAARQDRSGGYRQSC